MKKILIVDDSPINLKMADKTLRENPEYKPVPVPSGSRALKFLEQNKPDLILLDILMPEMDGFELYARLHADPVYTDIPVIFLTADEDPETKARAESLGVKDFLLKPFDKQILLTTVARYLA